MIPVRAACSTDIPFLIRFNQALAAETEGYELSATTLEHGIRRLMDRPEFGFYVVAVPDEEPGTPVGCTMVTYEWSDWRDGVIWWLQSAYVDRNWRGRGVFRSLLNHLEGLARKDSDVRGLRLYVADANARAHRTYDRLGLERASCSVRQKLFQER